ncbi:MAG TPA: hypothetical protein VJR48_07155, partial [Ktedonobacterales bacterium]|nr:hypothetical protein [Ktedonobacterales bacterium]
AKTLPNYDLRTISMGAFADGWLGGYKVTIVHGGQPFPGGNPSDLFSLNEPKLLHFKGGQWVEVSPPQAAEQPTGYPEYGQIASIRMVSATQGWLFAFFETQNIAPNDSTYLAPSIFQLENGHWTQIPAPLIHGQRYATMGQVSVISSTELWGIGECISPTGTPYGTGYLADVTPLIVHYKDGVWKVVES